MPLPFARLRRLIERSRRNSAQARSRRRGTTLEALSAVRHGASLPEALESRIMLTVTPSLRNGQAIFTDTSAADDLILGVNSGMLQYSTDAGASFAGLFNTPGGGTQAVALSSISSISVSLTSGADTLEIAPAFASSLTTAGVTLTFTGSSDAVLQSDATAGDAAQNWTITGPTSGTLDAWVHFSGIGRIIGGAGSDSFRVLTTSTSSLGISGGGGGDTLDYSGLSSAVTVNLSTGTATGVGPVSGVENVTGGSGNDLLVGDDQANILDGGSGADTLQGNGGGDTYRFENNWGTGTIIAGDGLVSGDDGDRDTFDFSAVTANLTASVAADETVKISAGTNSVTTSEVGDLIGGSGQNTLDYSSYGSGITADLADGDATDFPAVSGFEDVVGSAHDDLIRGDASINNLQGGAGDDTLSGGGNADILAGGAGVNWLTEQDDANIVLTNTSLTVGGVASTISGFSHARLTGGVDPNVLNASGFTGAGVVIDGGSDNMPLSVLNGGKGVRTADEDTLNVLGEEGTTTLASLNNGDGVRRATSGPDFRVTLTDGSSFDVTLGSAVTLADAMAAIQNTANAAYGTGRLTVELDPVSGDAIVLQDSKNGGGTVSIAVLNGSHAASDLGILGGGPGTVFEGTPITDVSQDVLITLSNGTRVGIDLSGLSTVPEILSAFTSADPRLTATINAAGTGIDLTDTAGGSGNLTVSARNGSNAASDLGILGAGTGPVLHGSSLVTGNIRLDGRLDADTIIGSPGNDTITGGGGNDSIAGDGGFDTLVETLDANFTLTNNSLTFGPNAESLSGIGEAILTGGSSANRIDASTFSGPVVIDGMAGNDTILGGAGNDTLTGGAGIDSINGGGGTNTLVESDASRFVAVGSAGSATLDMGEGPSEVVTITIPASVTSGTYRLAFGGLYTNPISFNAVAAEIQGELSELPNIGEDGVTVERAGAGLFTVTFVGINAGQAEPAMTATDVQLVGGTVAVAVTTQGMDQVNTLADIQDLDLTAGPSDSLFDVSKFTGGATTLIGGPGNDTMIGSPGPDLIIGNAGNDAITGNAGNDTLIGGAGTNTLLESRDADFTLTDSTLTLAGPGVVSTEIDAISGFEIARLTGGTSANRIDASGFTGITPGTDLVNLNGGLGLITAGGSRTDLASAEASTRVAVLNDGQGLGTVAGADLRIILSDGKDVDVDLSAAVTLADVFALIQAQANAVAPGRVAVVLDPTGQSVQITDSRNAGQAIRAQDLNGSTVVEALGLTGSGTGGTLTGAPFLDGGADIRIFLMDGSAVDVSFPNLSTIGDVLTAVDAAGPELNASIIAGQIVVTDSGTGSGRLTIVALNGSTAGTQLGLIGEAPSGSRGTLIGLALGIGSVVLNGGAGNDTLIGSPGNDTLTGGAGSDSINGGGGINTLVEASDSTMTLTNTTFADDPVNVDAIQSIQRAILTGGPSANLIDASSFSSSVTLIGGGGLDTLKGGSGGNNEFDLDTTGLTIPTSPTDAAHQFAIAAGGGTNNQVVIDGIAQNVTQADLNWVNFLSGTADYVLSRTDTQGLVTNEGDETITLTTDLVYASKNVTLEAGTVNTNGHTINTGGPTSAGNITITAKHITIDGGSQLLAVSTIAGGTSGTIKIEALDNTRQVTGLGFANVDLISTDVSIGSATIKGGTVDVSAVADSTNFLNASDFGNKTLGDDLPSSLSKAGNGAESRGLGAANDLLNLIEGLSAVIGVSVSESSATVHIGAASGQAPTVIVADDFSATTDAAILINAAPIGIKAGIDVGVGIVTSEVTIGNANITASHDATIESTANDPMTVKATVIGAENAVTVAVSVLDTTSKADVESSAVLTVGHDLFVQANTTDAEFTLAMSVPGGDGKLGVSSAVRVEIADTDAYLDGTATVGDNVNVTTRQQGQTSSADSGVAASSGVGTNSSGDIAVDVKSTTLATIKTFAINWLKSKILGSSGSNAGSGARPSFQVAASVAVVVDDSTDVARIGDGVTGDHAVVRSGAALTVKSEIDEQPNLSASASDSKGSTDFNGDTLSGTTKNGLALAGAAGDYDRSAFADLAGNATVDASGALTVKAVVKNEFDPSTAWGANLVTPFLSSASKPTYTTADGTKNLNAGDTVQLASGYAGGGDAGKAYEYIGADGASINLGTEDFSKTTEWKSTTLGADYGLAVVGSLTTYLNNNLGLNNDLVNTWTQSTATGQSKLAVAGAFTVVLLDHEADARIKSGAQVNQNAGYRSSHQDVTVSAQGTDDEVNFGGNIQTPSFSELSGIQSGTTKQTWSFDKGAIKTYTPLGTGGTDRGLRSTRTQAIDLRTRT